MAVDRDRKRKIFDHKEFYAFTAEILKGDHLAAFDTLARESACSADGTEINGFIPDDRINDRRASLSLSDHCRKSPIQKVGRELVHSARGCRSAGADRKPGLCPGRSRVVDDRAV